MPQRRRAAAAVPGDRRRRGAQPQREYLIRRILWMLQAGERGGGKRAAFKRRTFAESCDLGVLLDTVAPGRIVLPPLPEVHHMEFTIEFEREAERLEHEEASSEALTITFRAA